MSSMGIMLKKSKDSTDFDLTQAWKMKTQSKNYVLPFFYFFFFLSGIVSIVMLLL